MVWKENSKAFFVIYLIDVDTILKEKTPVVWLEAHTDVLNQKYLLQKKQDFKPTWVEFFINFNPRSFYSVHPLEHQH